MLNIPERLIYAKRENVFTFVSSRIGNARLLGSWFFLASGIGDLRHLYCCCGLEVSVESELLFDGSSNWRQERSLLYGMLQQLQDDIACILSNRNLFCSGMHVRCIRG